MQIGHGGEHHAHRIMIAGGIAAHHGFQRRNAAIKHLVDTEIETVGVISDRRTESGIAIGILQIVSLYGSLGIAAGDIVEIPAHYHRA